MKDLRLNCEAIGAGLFIEHGFCTIINAESIGRDCSVNQQVTIGWSEHGRPTLGRRVRIGAGAVVIGPVTIGDGATIGANATVVNDVPKGAVMLGPKAVPHTVRT